ETSARSAAQTAHERRVNEVCEQVRRRPPHKIIRIKKRGAHSIHASSDKNHFNRQLKQEKVFDLKGLINLSLMFHDLLSRRGIREISEFWKDEKPDGVVSVTPMYSPALYRAARLANPKAHCVTIPVDFEEGKPRYWFTPKVEQHYLLATARLEQQARAA